MRFDFKLLVYKRSEDLKTSKLYDGIWFQGCPTVLMLYEALSHKESMDDYYITWGDAEQHVFPLRVEDLHNPLPGWCAQLVEEPGGETYWKSKCVLVPMRSMFGLHYLQHESVYAVCHCCGFEKQLLTIEHPDESRKSDGRVLAPCAMCSSFMSKQDRRRKMDRFLTRTSGRVQRIMLRAENWGDSPLKPTQYQ